MCSRRGEEQHWCLGSIPNCLDLPAGLFDADSQRWRLPLSWSGSPVRPRPFRPHPEIVAAEDFSLAEAARPAFGGSGVWFTVVLAVVATASGVMASVFAASRMLGMLGMLTHMKQVPHRHLAMPGTIRIHTTVYTVVLAMALTATLDLTRIAALGAIYYLLMDLAIHWGLLRHLRTRIAFQPAIVVAAIVLDVVVLGAFVWVKASSDALSLYTAGGGIILIILGQRLFMRSHTRPDGTMDM